MPTTTNMLDKSIMYSVVAWLCYFISFSSIGRVSSIDVWAELMINTKKLIPLLFPLIFGFFSSHPQLTHKPTMALHPRRHQIIAPSCYRQLTPPLRRHPSFETMHAHNPGRWLRHEGACSGREPPLSRRRSTTMGCVCCLGWYSVAHRSIHTHPVIPSCRASAGL